MTVADLKQCGSCKYMYPPDLVAPMRSGLLIAGREIYKPESFDVCGECYRLITNKIHGFNRKKLNGPKAEQMRLAGIKYKKDQEAKEK